MKNIQAVKIGNVVNVSINGKLHKKNCGSPQEADELFKIVLEAKENPTDDNINKIRAYFNEKLRVAFLAGLETDLESGNIFMAGFNTPIPTTLVEVIKEYHENKYPMDAILNFWKLLMTNPDKRVRADLFDFIHTHDFVLTDKGYMVVYKAVYEKQTEGEEDADTTFAEFISKQYLHVKKNWSCSPNKYVVYRIVESGEFNITKKVTADKWDEKERGVEILGKLGELFDAIFNTEVNVDEENTAIPIYTDMHTQKMTIILGEPVKQARKDCDANPRIDCSNGLHVGATRYVEKFANWHNNKKSVLVCYVNPAHVVAVPQYDHSKMRVCEYFPFAIANYDGKKIDIIEQAYFESDYCEYEADELAEQIEALQNAEVKIEVAQNAEQEDRPMSELLKIIESRLVDLE